MAKNDIYKLVSTTKRTDGRYMKRISVNGKLIPIYGHTHEEVVDKYLSMKEEQNKNNLKINSYTFEEWTNKWLKLYKTDIITLLTKNKQKANEKNKHGNCAEFILIGDRIIGPFQKA